MMKFKYLRPSALYYLAEGLSFDIGKCAEVLDSALVGLNQQTGIPEKIVRWNRLGGHKSGPLKLGTLNRIAIEVTETASKSGEKMHLATVIESKGERESGPVVFLAMQSLALHIPMRVELPLRALLRGGPYLEGTYVVYLHVLFSDDDKEYVYYGITKRGWNYRFGEHMKAALGTRQARLFPQKMAELVDARVAQLAGRDDGRPKLTGVITVLCSVGVDEDMAKDTEEYLVDKYSLASKHSLGLNMIPGGREGVRVLHQLAGREAGNSIETEAREEALVEYLAKYPQVVIAKPGVAAAWNDPAYAEAVICGRENRLTAEQVRKIRYLAAMGHDLPSIGSAVGAIDAGQVRRVLAGRTYSRIH
ncbi:hypothetical protein IVA93_39825 (plasmid) [Bradyrhizobium sp. 155]|uniref:hypothetical protein n=1 Tax=Bradyrhizobium sp. 155 TaxID=2782629 RepID=UPI001FFF051D|nr:hypothetical protein [Bradyrhizobium sp. 155]UPK15955.1 hypothetical protein IVA93_39825 [Bradyrhizobium sp. 155]